MRSTTLLAIGLALGPALAGATFVHAADTSGFLYGTITTKSGQEHEGRLRWGTEECAWGDLFNSSKAELPRRDEVPSDRRARRHTLNLFGFEIDLTHHGASGRQFVARFGDIDRIEVTGRDDAVVVMKSGRRVEVEGGSNDLGRNTKIAVWDASLGKVELEWRKIDRIQFRPTPRDLPVADHRLYGVVHTDAGDFRGWIQWDQDECLSTDVLDGETEDGDLDIPMGNIRTIEPRGRRSSRVVLVNGQKLDLERSADVGKGNAGVLVLAKDKRPAYVPWEEAERIVFGR